MLKVEPIREGYNLVFLYKPRDYFLLYTLFIKEGLYKILFSNISISLGLDTL